jgi:SAM-dependent methyltransferase
MTNTYSPTWFNLFLETQPYTEQETAFVRRQLPNPPYRRVLDVACGQGRHARLLAQHGYEVVGIDVNEAALAIARAHTTAPATYLYHDMRRLEALPGSFNVILSLWQSFGYFDEVTNRDILRQMSQKLTANGRLILDLYHREFFQQHQGARQVERRGMMITITDTMVGNRLLAQLEYEGGQGGDTFEWQLFTPDEICQAAAEFGLHCLLVCTESDEHKPATPEKPRMQLVFEKAQP